MITGATANTNVQVESSVLGSTQPTGTGSISVGNGQYFDVEISGTSTGTANICITGVVDATTTMSYYSGGGWSSATGITRTLSTPAGASNGQICGNVPIADLTGTYFTVGDPLVNPSPASIVYGHVTWTTPTYQGFQYFFTASVSINGVQFSAIFTESLYAQYQLTPTLPYAGFYGGTFGAISGCQPGSTITLTATVNGLTKSASALCPAYGNSTAINLSFTTSSSGMTSAVPISLFTPWLSWISSIESYIIVLIAAFGILTLGAFHSRLHMSVFGILQSYMA
jgi:hypothetical protein